MRCEFDVICFGLERDTELVEGRAVGIEVTVREALCDGEIGDPNTKESG